MLSKYEFGCVQWFILFGGHIVSDASIQIELQMIDVAKTWPEESQDSVNHSLRAEIPRVDAQIDFSTSFNFTIRFRGQSNLYGLSPGTYTKPCN